MNTVAIADTAFGGTVLTKVQKAHENYEDTMLMCTTDKSLLKVYGVIEQN